MDRWHHTLIVIILMQEMKSNWKMHFFFFPYLISVLCSFSCFWSSRHIKLPKINKIRFFVVSFRFALSRAICTNLCTAHKCACSILLSLSILLMVFWVCMCFKSFSGKGKKLQLVLCYCVTVNMLLVGSQFLSWTFLFLWNRTETAVSARLLHAVTFISV